MGEIFIGGLCFDDLARHYGTEAAQEWWEMCGMAGKYINGFVACPSMQGVDGLITWGAGTGKYKGNSGAQSAIYDQWIKTKTRLAPSSR